MIETTPVYPAIGIVTNCPPCASCGGPMQPDIVLGDLEQCATCGCRRMVPKVAAAANNSATREALAAYAHEAWSGWMRYLFSNCANTYMRTHPAGIPAWAVERWERQMNTPYADLPEDEKQSDRAEADKMLAIAAAATGRDDIRALFEEVLTDLQSTWLASSESDSDREIIRVDIDEYRARLAALLGRV